MPTYEYECSKCGEMFEAFQRISEAPLKKCQLCGAKGTVSRLISPGAGLIFKGSGFYITDYKKSGAAATETAAEKKAGEAEPAAEKPAEKKEKKDVSAKKTRARD
ncbi:MAG: zinc ribbon domain-containing protein [Candidatus Sumerlaeia bacterium]|nr:zinc ribbon domain-containing protein [Candidatus Sumerlaeia bacterium]